MAGRKVEAEQARQHECVAWSMRMAGSTQAQIAAHLGLDAGSVSRILSRCRKRRLKEVAEEVDAERAEQTDRLKHVLDEALQAWQRSKLPAEKTTREYVELPPSTEGAAEEGGEAGQAAAPARAEEVKHERTGRDGDVRFLAEARAALAELRQLWGLDATPGSGPAGATGRSPIAIGEVTIHVVHHEPYAPAGPPAALPGPGT